MIHFFHGLFPFISGVAFGVLAMTIHELGHITAALLLGIQIKQVGLRWKGLYTIREAGSPLRNIAVSLTGPLVNLALTLTVLFAPTFALANFCIALGNLIPIRGSDGYRILVILRQMAKEKSEKSKK